MAAFDPRTLVVTLAVLGCAATPVQVTQRSGSRPGADVAALQAVARASDQDESIAYRGGTWDPAYFDELLPSDELSIEGLRHRHRRSGVGVPMTGLRLRAEDDPSFYPPEGITRAVTAVALPDAGGSRALRLLDPVLHAEVATESGVRPLAADFTAPFALLLSRTRFGRLAIQGTLRHEAIEEQSGVFLLEPYDPSKIPLLMVHGLLSSPLTWRELTNEVFGDEEIRARYQVWHAVYPTGIPYLHAAADFREQLHELRGRLDPEGDDFATDHIVVVAHSKGGLLAKTLVADSGDRLWNAAFTESPEEIVASPEDLAEMRRFLFFEREPAVRRVVFIAAPHRGSRLAENPVARWLASWIALPLEEKNAFDRVLRENEERLTPGFRPRSRTGLPSGPRALSSEDPLIGPLASLPVHPVVAFHTIVGQAEPGLRSDGVVDHESSYLPGAESELVVQGYGHDVHQSEAAITEVMRILRLQTPPVGTPRTDAAP
jgi:hypothetical protein